MLVDIIVGFATTFFGVFLAVAVDKAIANSEAREASLKMISLQHKMCLQEYEKLTVIDITTRPLQLPRFEMIALMPTFLQFLSDDVETKNYANLQSATVDLSMLDRQITDIMVKTPGVFFLEPIRHPRDTDEDWQYTMARFNADKHQWKKNTELLRINVNSYTADFKKMCELLAEFKLKS